MRGLACPDAADQRKFALLVQQGAGGETTDQGLVDLGRIGVELRDRIGQRQLGDPCLKLERACLLFVDPGGREVANDLLRV